jgi:hypothetical protein
VASRILLGHRPWLAITCGPVAGAVVLAPLYWVYMLPERMRTRVREYLAARSDFVRRRTGWQPAVEESKTMAAVAAGEPVHDNQAR